MDINEALCNATRHLLWFQLHPKSLDDDEPFSDDFRAYELLAYHRGQGEDKHEQHVIIREEAVHLHVVVVKVTAWGSIMVEVLLQDGAHGWEDMLLILPIGVQQAMTIQYR